MLRQPWFLPALILMNVLGHGFDLAATYVHQPNFEHEANPLYRALTNAGINVGWPAAIGAKAGYILLLAFGLTKLVSNREVLYPERGKRFGSFFLRFLFKGEISWVATLYKIPRFAPCVLLIFISLAVAFPHAFHAGYGNLAAEYGWSRLSLGSARWGDYHFFYDSVPIAILSFGLALLLLWQDYRSEGREPASAPTPLVDAPSCTRSTGTSNNG